MALRDRLLYPFSRFLLLPLITVLVLAGCRIEVVSPQKATVITESGSFACPAGETCILDVNDASFDETFVAVPDEGFYFAGWRPAEGALCGGTTTPCRLQVGSFANNDKVMALLNQDTTYPLLPRIVPAREFDFTGVDSALQYFLSQGITDGFSVLILHRDFGVIFEKAYGNFELDRVVQLRSASKLASATLMMALDNHSGVDFTVQSPIGGYLPFEGVYGDRSSEQLVSQVSGIPGNAFWIYYEPHLCQYDAGHDFHECGQRIYQSELPGTQPAGTRYSYGGSQWQLAGLVATHASGKSWGKLFQQLIAGPCDMEVFRYGNLLSSSQAQPWDGNPEHLPGKDNPNIEGGAIANLRDYGKLIALHLNDGWCGNRQVLAPGGVEFMRIDRSMPAIPPENDLDGGYAMGAFINNVAGPNTSPVYVTPGALGTIAWIDNFLDYGAVFMTEVGNFDDYPDVRDFTGAALIPQVRAAVEASLTLTPTD